MSVTPGSYILLLRLDHDAEAEVGSLGRLWFPAGWYAYAGSARNGLEGRVGRHFSVGKRMRWHIDRLTMLSAEMLALTFLSESAGECALAAALIEAGGRPTPPGFGSSDCRCRTHLFHLDDAALKRAIDLPCDGVMRPPTGAGGDDAGPVRVAVEGPDEGPLQG